MTATELRKGNLLWFECTQHIVTGVDHWDKVYSVWHKALNELPYIACIEQYEPIELDEEWLTKLGFQRRTKYHSLVYGRNNLELEKDGAFWTDANGCVLVDIYFVHQVQNIYYAIYGEELPLISNSDKP